MISVIYVDDEPDLLEICKLFLEIDQKFHVDTANSADVAWALMQKNNYEAIISDYQMPGTDGIQFLKQVRASGDTIPFIIFTGRGREEIVIQAINEGADFYLQKGGDPQSQFAELAHKVTIAVDRRRAKEVLHESEERFLNAFKYAAIGMALVAPGGQWLRANQSLCEIIGYNEDELQTMTFQDITHPDDLDADLEYVHRMISGEIRTYQMEKRYFHKSGQLVWVLLSVSLVRDNQGKPRYFISQIENITGRKRAEEDLKESEEDYRRLVELSSDGIWLLDKEFLTVYVNPAMEKMLGYSKDEMKGRSWYAFGDPLWVRRAKELEKRRESGIGEPHEFLFLHKDGRKVHTRISTTPLYDNGGNFDGALGILCDITRLKQAEEALRESEEKYRNLVELAREGIWALDADGNTTFVNPRMAEMFGYTVEEMTGRHLFSFMDERGRKVAEVRLGQRSQGTSDHFESEFIRKDGRRITAFRIAAPLTDTDGTYTGSVAFLTDITDQKGTEERLLNSEQKYRTLIETSPDMIWEIDMKGSFTYMSPQSSDILGYSAEELVGKSMFSLLLPESVSKIRDLFLSQLNTGGFSMFELLVRHRDGSTLCIEIRSSPVFGQGGEITGLRGIARDITKEKQAEENLKKTSAQLGERLKELHCILSVSSILASPGITNERKISRVLEVTPSGFLYPEITAARVILGGRAEQNANFRETAWKLGQPILMEGKQVGIIDIVYLEERPAQAEGPFLAEERDLINNIAERLGRFIEITTAEEQIRVSEQKYRSVFETTGAATVVIENDGTISLANSEFGRLCGLPKEEIENKKKWMDFVVKEDLDRMTAQHTLRRKDRDKALRHYEFRFLPHSGEIRHIYLTIDMIPGTNTSIASLIDITELKRAGEALKNSEALYRSIIENIQDAFYRIEKEGRLIMASPSLASMLGYDSLDDCLGFDIAGKFYYEPEKRKDFLQAIGKTGQVNNYEITLKRKDGSPLHVTASSHYYYDDQGAIAGVEGIFRDITGRRQMEELLKGDKELFRAIFESSGDLIHLIDTSGIIISTNRLNLAVTGYSENELVGKYIRDFFTPASRELFDINFPILVEKGRNRVEVGFICKDGRTLVLDCSASVVRDSNGAIKNFVVFQKDITEEKKVKEELIASEEKYRLLAERTNDIIYTLDLAGNLTYLSPQISRYGYMPEDIISGGLNKVILAEDLPLVLEDARITATTGNPTATVFRIRDNSGAIFWMEDNGSAVYDASGNIVSIYGIVRDITERKQVQETLRKANHQLYLLGSITRHDINNKVSVILGNLTVAAKMSDSPAMQEFIGKIRLATLAIQSQIEFTKIYQDLGCHDPQWQDVNVIVTRLAVPQSITLKSELNGLDVYADPILDKVFYNLLDNSDRHGENVTEISVSCSESGEGLKIVWQDNGVGIPAGDNEKIFERGFGKNTGFGLFLVREILLLTDITIKETGEPGKGARFEITVPKGMYRIKS